MSLSDVFIVGTVQSCRTQVFVVSIQFESNAADPLAGTTVPLAMLILSGTIL